MWQLIASYADRRVVGAVQHGLWVWRLERDLHLPSEASLQHLILHQRWLVEASNVFYAGVHVPALGILLVWLFVRHRDRFARYRDTLAVLTLLCLLAYIVPVAPPRLLPRLGMVDTGLAVPPVRVWPARHGDRRPAVGDAVGPHGVVVVHRLHGHQVSGSRWRWFMVAHPALTMLVVVVTANHYWLDGAAAAVLLAVAIPVAAGIEQRPRPAIGSPWLSPGRRAPGPAGELAPPRWSTPGSASRWARDACRWRPGVGVPDGSSSSARRRPASSRPPTRRRPPGRSGYWAGPVARVTVA